MTPTHGAYLGKGTDAGLTVDIMPSWPKYNEGQTGIIIIVRMLQFCNIIFQPFSEPFLLHQVTYQFFCKSRCMSRYVPSSTIKALRGDGVLLVLRRLYAKTHLWASLLWTMIFTLFTLFYEKKCSLNHIFTGKNGGVRHIFLASLKCHLEPWSATSVVAFSAAFLVPIGNTVF